MTAPSILLVEDSDADAEVIERALTRHLPSALIQRVGTVGEAMATLGGGNTPPDLLLADINLPDTSGLVLLARIRRDPDIARLPVVVLTGSARQQEVDAAYAGGAHGFLSKPMAPAEMARVIGHVCDYWFRAVRRPGAEASA